jgi:hypothetical protein
VAGAPPVYRPVNPVAKAPAVYRPNAATPLQGKVVAAASTVYRPANPVANTPAVYRPNAALPLQRMPVAAAPSVYRHATPVATASAMCPHPAGALQVKPVIAAPQQKQQSRAVAQRSPFRRPAPATGKSATASVIQRVSRIFIGRTEIKETDPEGPQVFNALNSLTNQFKGEVWFNSGAEMVAWIRSLGTLEGIGVWDSRWMNFSGKGPIVFGEEHNEIRTDFIKALNIKHYVVEGAFERSLSGVDPRAIPAHSSSQAHQVYTGNEQGKALENYWIRSAQSMARFWRAFEQDLDQLDPRGPLLSQIERVGELSELVNTIRGSRVQPGTPIQIQLDNARFHLDKAMQAGLGKLLDIMKLAPRAYTSRLRELIDKIEIGPLQFAFTEFRKSVEQLGYLNFAADASPEELDLDERTKGSKEPFEVWGGRREHFMLKNLEAALTKNPPPLITTMGAAHARHQQDALQQLLRRHGGMLIIGSIVELADVGAAKMHLEADAVSVELSTTYGWSESYRREFADSSEAKEMAKIRLSNTKQPMPPYLS